MTLPYRNIYCIGIGGVGVSAVARFYLAAGSKVSGSDIRTSPLIDDVRNSGATVFIGHDPRHVPANADLVVYTDDCGPEHVERQAAQRLGLKAVNFSAALAELMDQYSSRVAIAGTNGKSTTTALVGLILSDAGRDPSVFIGSRLSQFNGNIRLGQGNTFVAEADEYRDHFLALKPTCLVMTNLELDHVDYFRDLDHLQASFAAAAGRVPDDGVLVVNADDPALATWRDDPRTITYGFEAGADVRILDYVAAEGKQVFSLLHGQEKLGPFELRIPGRFNVMNATAAITAALALDVPSETFARTLAAYHGVWRRFEVLNPGQPVTIVNDYAHHPTAIRVTIEGAKDFYPGRRIVAAFQPHHTHRLTSLYDDFLTAFDQADTIVLTETYAVRGRSAVDASTKTARQLSEDLAARGRSVSYAASVADLETHLSHIIQPGDVVLLMGAGDIWTIAESLVQRYA